jgi:hypothetical protein
MREEIVPSLRAILPVNERENNGKAMISLIDIR